MKLYCTTVNVSDLTVTYHANLMSFQNPKTTTEKLMTHIFHEKNTNTLLLKTILYLFKHNVCSKFKGISYLNFNMSAKLSVSF